MQIQFALTKTSTIDNKFKQITISTIDNKFVDYDKKIRGTQHANQHSSKTIYSVNTTGDIQSYFHSVYVR